jgi:hypothetical protein
MPSTCAVRSLETISGRRAGLVPRDLAERLARFVEESLLALRLGRQRGLAYELERALELLGRELLQPGVPARS